MNPGGEKMAHGPAPQALSQAEPQPLSTAPVATTADDPAAAPASAVPTDDPAAAAAGPAAATATADPWSALRRFTPARIALGRAGNALPTAEALGFALAHARARDAVHAALDAAALQAGLADAGFESLVVRSAAADRAEYLRRPDLGRRLDPESTERLVVAAAERSPPPPAVVFVVADGLSALAIERHALALLRATVALLHAPVDGAPAPTTPTIGPVVVAVQGRVALGDAIGELLGARQLVMLIGERPGLSSPDGLGIYLTHAPRVGRTDAERNCISNVRPEGLAINTAAARLVWLLREAARIGSTGVALKDGSDGVDPAGLGGSTVQRLE